MTEIMEERCPSERRGMQGDMVQCTRFLGHEGDHMVASNGSSSLKWPNQADLNLAGDVGLSRDQVITINRALLLYAQSDADLAAQPGDVTPRMNEVLTLTTRVDAFDIEDVG